LNEYKLFVQRIGLMGITQILVTLSTIILLPILTKNYSVSDYGIWVQINVTITLFPTLITLGLPLAIVRFIASVKEREKIQDEFYSIALIILISSLIASFLFFIFSDAIAALLLKNNVVAAKTLALIIFFASLNLIFINFYRALQRMKAYSIIVLLQTYTSVFLVAYFAISGYSIEYTIIGILISQIIILVISLVAVVSTIGITFPSLKRAREYLSFGIPTISSGLSYWIVDSSDRYIVGILLGTTFVGYYSPSYTLGNLIMMIIYPFNIILPSLLSKYYDENKMDEVRIFLKYSLKFFLAFAIPAAVGLSLLSRIIIQILSTPEIAANGYFVTPFVTLSAIFFGVYSIALNILLLTKQTKKIGLLWVIAAILNIALNLILIPYFGLLGSAMATLAAYTTAFIITLIYSLRAFKFEFDLMFIGKSIIAAVLMSIIIIIFYPANLLSLIIVIVVSFAVYMAVLTLLKGFKKEEIDFVKTLLSR